MIYAHFFLINKELALEVVISPDGRRTLILIAVEIFVFKPLNRIEDNILHDPISFDAQITLNLQVNIFIEINT